MTRRDNVIEIFTSSEGSSGTKVSLYRSALLSALTIANTATSIDQGSIHPVLEQVRTVLEPLPSAYLQLMMVRPSRSMQPDCPWVCSNRHCQYRLPACSDRRRYVRLSQPSPLRWRRICVRQSEADRRCRYRRECEPREVFILTQASAAMVELDQRHRPDASPVRGYNQSCDRPPSRVNLQKSSLPRPLPGGRRKLKMYNAPNLYQITVGHPRVTTSPQHLASGKRIISPGRSRNLVGSHETQCAVNRMAGARNNVQNGISFVEPGRCGWKLYVGRMAELKGTTQDPLKSSQDVESYNNEFRDLQKLVTSSHLQTEGRYHEPDQVQG